MILLISLLDEKYETFILTLINSKQLLSYSDVSTALVNHEVRRKDKEFSSNSTTVKALSARGISFNHQKGKGDVGKSKPDKRKLRNNQCASARKDIERLIVQGSRKRRDRNQTLHRRMMVLIMTLEYCLSISPIVCYSEESQWIWIRVIPIMFVLSRSDLLILKN